MNDVRLNKTQPDPRNAFLRFLLLCMVLFGTIIADAQSGTAAGENIRQQIDSILSVNRSQDNITQSTAGTLEHLYHTAKKQGYKQEMQDAGIMLMTYYINNGIFQKVIAISDDIKTRAQPVSAENAANLYRLLGRAYSSMGFASQSYTAYQLAVQSAQKIARDSDMRHYTLAKAYQNYINYFDQNKKHVDSIPYYIARGLEEAELIKDQSKTVPKGLKYGMIITMQYTAGLYYLYMTRPPDTIRASKHFLAALQINDAQKGNISKARELDLCITVSQFYFSKKKYDSSIYYGLKALHTEKEIPSPYKRASIYKILGEAYDEENDEKQSLQYWKLLVNLNYSLKGIENKEISAAIQQITYLEQKTATDRQRRLIAITGGAFLASLLAAFLLWRSNNRRLRKRYYLLIEKLQQEKEKAITAPQIITADEAATWEEKTGPETDDNPDADSNDPAVKETAPIVISDEKVTMLLAKLEKFETQGKYLNKDINLSSLAHQFGTNTRYLSEAIRQYSDKTFSSYVNGLKINYIMLKLYEEPVYRNYKLSHLANKSGFASRQVFVQAFKKETGVTPSYFIEQLKEEEK